MAATRDSWNSKLGFILAASGSAIGLGNIVFFSSNAYQFGGGAFYIPYFLALFLLGLPVMIMEFGLGTLTGRALPEALFRTAGRRAEFVGWWSLGSALFITMYYQAILAWALGMTFGAFGSLFEAGVTAPFAPFQTPSEGVNATAYFFSFISTWWPLLCVVAIWSANVLVLWRGTSTIERAVRVFVPVMWIFMIILIVQGLSLPGGLDGVLYLFTPDLDGIWSLGVWRGAFSQMFFSLSLGLGTMTAYASYLPKDADQVNNALLVSFMNCGFEYIAGVAIFSLLFAFALNPVGGTLTLAFFVIPQGIAQFPGGEAVVVGFGAAFFFLLVIAGITSSISLIESPASALIDKLGVSRAQALALVAGPGVLGSLCFTLPLVIDPALAGNGTLGLTLLDVVDHWAFGYSLITVGFFECLMIGWVFGAERLRAVVNQHTKLPLGAWFDVLIKFIAPGLLGTVIVLSLAEELSRDTLYGMIDDMSGFDWVPVVMPFVWLFGTLGMAAYLTFGRDYPEPERRATVPGEADAPRTPQTAA